VGEREEDVEEGGGFEVVEAMVLAVYRACSKVGGTGSSALKVFLSCHSGAAARPKIYQRLLFISLSEELKYPHDAAVD
jgi:hypothetical protein